jgi:hypothetical protein
MKLLRRILISVVITVAGILAGIYWIAPIALSFYTARAVPDVARVVPTEL